MMTFLDLVNAFIVEVGINGGQLITATGGGTLAPGTGTPGQGVSTYAPEVARAVSFVADADYEIQALHHNWKFLWRQFQGTLQVGQDWLATPQRIAFPPAGYVNTRYTLRKVDRESLTINQTSQTQSFRPRYLEWRTFERLWQSRGAKNNSDFPTNWSVTPAGNPLLSHASISGYPYQYECWIRPRRMAADGDVSPLVMSLANAESASLNNGIPSPFTSPPYLLPIPSNSASLQDHSVTGISTTATESVRHQSCRIIIVRAKIIYAEIEGAIDIMQAALAEYEDLLQELRADQLPGQEADRMSESDIELTVVSE